VLITAQNSIVLLLYVLQRGRVKIILQTQHRVFKPAGSFCVHYGSDNPFGSQSTTLQIPRTLDNYDTKYNCILIHLRLYVLHFRRDHINPYPANVENMMGS